jgi:hypothetical protein
VSLQKRIGLAPDCGRRVVNEAPPPAAHSLVLAKKFRGHYRIVKERIKIPGCIARGNAFQGDSSF